MCVPACCLLGLAAVARSRSLDLPRYPTPDEHLVYSFIVTAWSAAYAATAKTPFCVLDALPANGSYIMHSCCRGGYWHSSCEWQGRPHAQCAATALERRRRGKTWLWLPCACRRGGALAISATACCMLLYAGTQFNTVKGFLASIQTYARAMSTTAGHLCHRHCNKATPTERMQDSRVCTMPAADSFWRQAENDIASLSDRLWFEFAAQSAV
jgi:hypothetical protein